jgi:hypothetical protein
MNRTQIGRRIILAVCWVAALPAVLSGSAQAGAQNRAEFDAFFDKVSQAQVELFRGRAEPLKALWSRASDATLFGVLGGRGERGGDQVGPRLDWRILHRHADSQMTRQGPAEGRK